MQRTIEKTDTELQKDVMSELKYDPSVKVSDIGVIAKNGKPYTLPSGLQGSKRSLMTSKSSYQLRTTAPTLILPQPRSTN